MRCHRSAVLAAILTLAAACTTAEQGTTVDGRVAEARPVSLPALLRDPSSLAMEAIVAGRLTRRGECLYLGYADDQYALILWGDADVRLARLDENDWLINNYTTGQRFREGDMIRGGGGFYSVALSANEITRDSVPEGCDGQVVQIHDARKFDPAMPDGVPSPPPPPPPAPSRSRLLDDAFAYEPGGFSGPRRTLPAVASAEEAMFVYVLQDYSKDASHKCLRGAEDALRMRLQSRFQTTLHSERACVDDNGRSVLRANGEQAVSVFAQVDCSRLARLGYCAGAAGGYWANLGAQANAYRLRRKGDGWEVEKLGIGVIS